MLSFISSVRTRSVSSSRGVGVGVGAVCGTRRLCADTDAAITKKLPAVKAAMSKETTEFPRENRKSRKIACPDDGRIVFKYDERTIAPDASQRIGSGSTHNRESSDTGCRGLQEAQKPRLYHRSGRERNTVRHNAEDP